MPHECVAGQQIRWQSVGRVAAIAAAVIAGIFSLPALLGSDKPPPVPPDVGLTSPPTAAPAQAPVAPPPASPAPPTSSGHHRLAKHTPHRKHSHRDREPSHPRRPHQVHQVEPPVAPPAPSYPPPLYSYVPPPTPGEFQIER